jgi:hypothetical protein
MTDLREQNVRYRDHIAKLTFEIYEQWMEQNITVSLDEKICLDKQKE